MSVIQSDDILVAPLQRVRDLVRLRAALTVGVAGLAVLLAVLVIFRLARWGGLTVDHPAAAAVLLALIATGGAGFAVWHRRQSLQQLALQIDRARNLDYRYATAVDVRLEGEEPVPLVARVLVADAERDARTLAPRSLVSFTTPAILAPGAAALLLMAALALLPAVSAAPEPQAAVEEPVLDDAALARTLSDIADEIAADAEVRDDPYLTAVANALRERVAEVQSGAEDRKLAEDAAALLDHAAAAYGDDAPAWLGEDEAGRLPGLQARLDEFVAERERAEALAALGPTPAQGDFDYYGDTPEDRELAMRANQEPPGLGHAQASAPEAELDNSLGGAPQQAVRKLDFSTPSTGAGIPIGAAMQSGRGVSDAAGRGGQSLIEDDAFTALGSVVGQDMIVTANPDQTGNRIKIELTPEAGEIVDAGRAGQLSTDGVGAATAPGAREFVPPDRRSVVARYFNRNPQ